MPGPRGGRPRIGKEVRDLIRRMSIENPLWGAPRIHELLKLGVNVAQSTVSIYMVPRQGRPLQSWKSFLRNHGKELASIDLFVVPTNAFRRLFEVGTGRQWAISRYARRRSMPRLREGNSARSKR